VFFVAIFTSIGSLASIIQQIHLAANWRAIKQAEYANRLNPYLFASNVITGAAAGADLVLFWTRTFYHMPILLIYELALQLTNYLET
jgi:hypothetical protein